MFNTLRHESSFSKSNKRIKPTQSLSDLLSNRSTAGIFVSWLLGKIPVEVFAYLITKALCIYIDLPDLCEKNVLKRSVINVNCFVFSNKTNYNTYVFDESIETAVLVKK